MYFDSDECAHCGYPTPYQGTFGFCSDTCRMKAIRPFLSSAYESDENTDYDKYSAQVSALWLVSMDEIRANPHQWSDAYNTARTNRDNATTRFYAHKAELLSIAESEYVSRWTHAREQYQAKQSSQREEKLRKEQEAQARREERDHDKWLRDQQHSIDRFEKQEQKQLEEAAELRLIEEQIKPRALPFKLRYQGTHILGGSGTGKTQTNLKIVLDDFKLADPPGYMIIDPKGTDMVEPLAHLSIFFEKLRDRIVIIDPVDKPALSLFKTTSDNPAELIQSFSYIFSTANQKMTGQQATCFAFCMRLLMKVPNANLHTLLELLDDDPKNKNPLFQNALAQLNTGSAADTMALRFFHKDFYEAYKNRREELKTRIYAITQDDYLAEMFNASRRAIDVADCLEKGKIILVNTRMTKLKDNHMMLGRLMITLFTDAIKARADIPVARHHPSFLLVDEFQEFADATYIPHMLRLIRVYNAGAILAHHNMKNEAFDDNLRAAISQNCQIKLAHKPGGQEMNAVAHDLECTPEFLAQYAVSTNTHANFACKIPSARHPFIFSTPLGHINDWPHLSENEYQALRAANRKALADWPKKHKAPDGALRNVQTLPAETLKETTDTPTIPDEDGSTNYSLE